MAITGTMRMIINALERSEGILKSQTCLKIGSSCKMCSSPCVKS